MTTSPAFPTALLVLAAACAAPSPDAALVAADTTSFPEWSSYGGDPGGSRYSPLRGIDRDNVSRLEVAWIARTGDWAHEGTPQPGQASSCARCHSDDYKFETTPIIADEQLYVSTPFNRVIALDPATGAMRWRHDPKVTLNLDRNEGLVSRGVAFWRDSAESDTPCGRRILFGTIDARLLALDAVDGTPCADFGEAGTVRLDQDVGRVQAGQYGMTSPPVILGDLVIVGSSMGDNRRVDMERGVVRAYDVRSGRRVWAWDPIPRSAADEAYGEWTPEAAARTGGANAWPPLSVDRARGLVFVPTGSPAPDFYGGERPGNNRHGNSVVALEAATGKLVWEFQAVHHDLWDYDIAAQPSLITVPRGGTTHPAVVAATKMGFLFLLDRATGKPLFPVEERPVPSSTVPGERASPTQPFPTLPRPLHPLGMTEADLWGPTPEELGACRAAYRATSSSELFAPPSLEGIIQYPGFGGGINWGGVAWDRGRGLLIVNHLRLPMWVRLSPRSSPDVGNQIGTPYTMSRGAFVGPSGLPCVKPPWGVLTAVDLATGEVKWERPLGRPAGTDSIPEAAQWGSITLGGPIITAGGLTFIAATSDQRLRAFDTDTGEELWSAHLPAGAFATPMTYELDGRQYVVIAAGGHTVAGAEFGDYIIAYALPKPGQH
jgi:quinoprotein glucose dehydrogenase